MWVKFIYTSRQTTANREMIDGKFYAEWIAYQFFGTIDSKENH